jgi:hypothetical protein
MDVINVEFRLKPEGSSSFKWSEWEIEAEHSLILHQPTRALFAVDTRISDGADTTCRSVAHRCIVMTTDGRSPRGKTSL